MVDGQRSLDNFVEKEFTSEKSKEDIVVEETRYSKKEFIQKLVENSIDDDSYLVGDDLKYIIEDSHTDNVIYLNFVSPHFYLPRIEKEFEKEHNCNWSTTNRHNVFVTNRVTTFIDENGKEISVRVNLLSTYGSAKNGLRNALKDSQLIHSDSEVFGFKGKDFANPKLFSLNESTLDLDVEDYATKMPKQNYTIDHPDVLRLFSKSLENHPSDLNFSFIGEYIDPNGGTHIIFHCGSYPTELDGYTRVMCDANDGITIFGYPRNIKYVSNTNPEDVFYTHNSKQSLIEDLDSIKQRFNELGVDEMVVYRQNKDGELYKSLLTKGR